MARPVVRVDNLSKRYRLGSLGADTFREEVRHFLLRLRGRDPAEHLGMLEVDPAMDVSRRAAEAGVHWALRGVSFEIGEGEVVGVLGHNGAGKSTLLKILSRVTAPTEGEARIKGRVASLLEVGTGFHHELTGRENVFMNGAILGMTKAEIRRKMDEIVAFSELEKYIDTPVKRYSSGMYVRLAFAVAAHLEPEIFIVDEVLAVGDAQFQKKCVGKIGQVAAGGRTVLLVSHNLSTIGALCRRAILLAGGRKVADGPVDEVVSAYARSLSTADSAVTFGENEPRANNGRVRLVRAVVACRGEPASDVPIDEPVTLQVELEVLVEGLELASGIEVMDKYGASAFSWRTPTRPLSPGRYEHAFVIPANLLNDGRYSVTFSVTSQETRLELVCRDAVAFLAFEQRGGRDFLGDWPGSLRPAIGVRERKLGP